MSYIIATASTADLPRSFLDNHHIPFISYSYTVNGQLETDDCREENRVAVYRGMRRGNVLATSMINEFVYYDFFKELMQRGEDVIFLDMSEKMSASFEHCRRAAEKIRAKYPGQKLYVMDTRCVSGGLGILVMKMTELWENGADYDTAVRWGEENKLKIAHRFTVDDLNYLKRSGRVSNAAALVGSVLGIKPVLYVPNEGTLKVVRKVRGRKAALSSILDAVLQDLGQVDTAGRQMLILHADCPADAEYIQDRVRRTYPDMGKIQISSLGVVIGAHTGPGLLAIFYLCKERTPE